MASCIIKNKVVSDGKVMGIVILINSSREEFIPKEKFSDLPIKRFDNAKITANGSILSTNGSEIPTITKEVFERFTQTTKGTVLRLDVHCENRITGRICLDMCGDRYEKRCFVDGEDAFIQFPFLYINSAELARKYIKSRLVPPNRDNVKEVLSDLGLDKYNFTDLLMKTHGVMLNDNIWFSFISIPGDSELRYEQVKAR